MFSPTVNTYIFILVFVVSAVFQVKAQRPQVLSKDIKQVPLTNQTLSFFEDKQSKLSFEQIRKQNFQPVTRKGNSFGLSSSTYWFRLKLQNQDLSQRDWVLELAHPLLDTLDIYYQERLQWKSLRLGDRYVFDQRPIKVRNFVFPLKFIDTTTHTFYLRVHTTSTLQVPLTVYRPLAFAEKQEVEQMIFGMYYGILVVMMLYNLFIYFSLRKTTYLLYSTFIAFGTLCTATISGHTFQYIWSNLPWVANYSLAFSGFLYQIFFLLYAIAFLDLKKNLPRWVPVLYSLVVVYSALAIFSLFNISISIKIFALIGVINFPLVIFLSIKCYLRGFTAARFFILAWFVFMVGVVLYSLVTANVLPMNAFTRRLTDVGAVFAVILISFALADRYRLIKRAQEVMQNEMLEMQKNANEKLEKKVKERTLQLQMKSDEILTQNEELQQQQEEIIAQNEFIAGVNQQLKRQSKQTRESIQAAKAIQQAILPRPQRFKELPIADHFVIYKPKDIVSGDFYWVSKMSTALNIESLPIQGGGLQLTTKKLTPTSQEAVFLAVVDCTGHGVPGAFMSMIGNSLLNEIVNEARVFSPAKILTKLHEKVQQELKQTENSRLNQGMDMCLCKLEPNTNGVKVTFTGAKRPLFYIKDGEFGELKGDRLSIGGWSKKTREPFTEQTLELQVGDMLYLTTDGYVDTPNPQRKSFGTSRLKKLLANQANVAIAQQHENLETALNTYQLDADQRDDITMMGVRL